MDNIHTIEDAIKKINYITNKKQNCKIVINHKDDTQKWVYTYFYNAINNTWAYSNYYGSINNVEVPKEEVINLLFYFRNDFDYILNDIAQED